MYLIGIIKKGICAINIFFFLKSRDTSVCIMCHALLLSLVLSTVGVALFFEEHPYAISVFTKKDARKSVEIWFWAFY